MQVKRVSVLCSRVLYIKHRETEQNRKHNCGSCGVTDAEQIVKELVKFYTFQSGCLSEWGSWLYRTVDSMRVYLDFIIVSGCNCWQQQGLKISFLSQSPHRSFVSSPKSPSAQTQTLTRWTAWATASAGGSHTNVLRCLTPLPASGGLARPVIALPQKGCSQAELTVLSQGQREAGWRWHRWVSKHVGVRSWHHFGANVSIN